MPDLPVLNSLLSLLLIRFLNLFRLFESFFEFQLILGFFNVNVVSRSSSILWPTAIYSRPPLLQQVISVQLLASLL